MKIIIILIAAVIPQIVFSQEYEYVPFPDSGAIWSEVYSFGEPIWPDTVVKPPSFERFTVNGEDTVINEIVYKKLYMFYDSVFNKSKATCVGGIREDENKRIYFKSDTSVHDLKPMNWVNDYNEIVLYDFSLNVGDTIKDINCRPDDILIVSSIDTVLIKDSYRRSMHFQDFSWVNWIEGIGNIRGLLFYSGSLPTCSCGYGDLICFKQYGETLYFNNDYPDCFPILTGIETQKNDFSDIIVFPSPSNNKITFNLGKQQIQLIQIVDCNGRLCGNFDVQLQPEFNLSIEKYQPGIYFFKATNKNGTIHTGKFVVK